MSRLRRMHLGILEPKNAVIEINKQSIDGLNCMLEINEEQQISAEKDATQTAAQRRKIISETRRADRVPEGAGKGGG